MHRDVHALQYTSCDPLDDIVLQFLGWDQVSRNQVSQFAANYTGNQIVANEFLYNVTNQIIYN